MAQEPAAQKVVTRRNRAVAFACVGVFAGMVGLSYASVPLYRLFCQVTGFGGTPQIAEAAPQSLDEHRIAVRFDATVAPGLAWIVKPEKLSVKPQLGESVLAFYKATNNSGRPITGTASFNVTPDWAGAYFNKIECFCFTEQTLAAGESVDMPVTFFVDPAILDELGGNTLPAITLSYTFYAAEPAVVSAAKPQEGRGG